MDRITIIGAGRVGEATALALARNRIGDELVLLDRDGGAAAGAALDIAQSAAHFGPLTPVIGTADPARMAGSRLIIITAGHARRPGMSRADLLAVNAAVVDEVVDAVLRHAPDALLLMVTNPVDLLTFRARARTGWPRARVFGQAGALDAARMAHFVAEAVGICVDQVSALVIGCHGDAMLPLPRYTTIGGVPAAQLLDGDTLAALAERTRAGGAEVLALRGRSSAFQAPAAAIAVMADAILNRRRRLLSAVCCLEGEYGTQGIAIGVPALVGPGGIEQVVELDLDPSESRAFAAAAQRVAAALSSTNPMRPARAAGASL